MTPTGPAVVAISESPPKIVEEYAQSLSLHDTREAGDSALASDDGTVRVVHVGGQQPGLSVVIVEYRQDECSIAAIIGHIPDRAGIASPRGESDADREQENATIAGERPNALIGHCRYAARDVTTVRVRARDR